MKFQFCNTNWTRESCCSRSCCTQNIIRGNCCFAGCTSCFFQTLHVTSSQKNLKDVHNWLLEISRRKSWMIANRNSRRISIWNFCRHIWAHTRRICCWNPRQFAGAIPGSTSRGTSEETPRAILQGLAGDVSEEKSRSKFRTEEFQKQYLVQSLQKPNTEGNHRIQERFYVST